MISKMLFAKSLRDNALPPFGKGLCATYVRKALEAAGGDTTGHPVNARDWGPTLEKMGFAVVDPKDYTAQRGDVIVIQSTSTSKPGHIEGYDGKNWISDFVQPALWPGPSYREEKPAYKIYRAPG